MDVPQDGASLGGTASLWGWAFDNIGVNRVEIRVDSTSFGNATLGGSRPDIPNAYPNAISNAGWHFSLNTKKISDGQHTITARMYDAAGNFSDRSATVTINNKKSAAVKKNSK
jgi:hypothetical protein